MPFSEEVWDEIYAARARLEAYKLKVQPYPYREPETQPPPEQIIVHRHGNLSKQEFDLLQQTARKVEYLGKKLTERNKKKPQSKYS